MSGGPTTTLLSEQDVWLLLLAALLPFAVASVAVVVRDVVAIVAGLVLRIHGRPRPRPVVGGRR